MRRALLLTVAIIFLFAAQGTHTAHQSDSRATALLRRVCATLHDEALSSAENRQWETFCERWLGSMTHRAREEDDDDIVDEAHMEQFPQPRRSGARSSSRASSRSSRSSSSSRRSSGSGSRSSSTASRYRNTRTGAVISRPSGWVWSRTRHVFLPISRTYHYRSRSSSNRYTTPATSPIAYYYCSSDSNNATEIQCHNATGDSQCCEDETNRQVFCCGGEIDNDFVVDFSQGTIILARAFYTLSAATFLTHLIIKRWRY